MLHGVAQQPTLRTEMAVRKVLRLLCTSQENLLSPSTNTKKLEIIPTVKIYMHVASFELLLTVYTLRERMKQ